MLNARQQAFVNAYARGGFKNATQAAVTAGYSEKTADRIASRLLTNVEVREVAVVDAAFVFRELKDLVITCGQKIPVVDVTGEPMVDSEGEIIYRKLDPNGANTALKTLAQSLGMGKEQADKDQTIQALAETLRGVLK